jgi:hypothetical protein
VTRKRIHPLPPMPLRAGDRVGPLYSSSADRLGTFVSYVQYVPRYCLVHFDGEAQPRRVASRSLRLIERGSDVL